MFWRNVGRILLMLAFVLLFAWSVIVISSHSAGAGVVYIVVMVVLAVATDATYGKRINEFLQFEEE